MTQMVFTDRSRIETAQRCRRLRWLEYHEQGMGITSARKPLPLAVGGAVHVGLATLLECSLGIPLDELSFELAELKAVQAALEDFAQFANALEVDTSEQLALTDALKVDDPELLAKYQETLKRAKSDFDVYLYMEQSALVEALVRAYARRRLRPLLEQFEVLEVEREGSWKLSEWHEREVISSRSLEDSMNELWFMSRPDALLRERQSNALYLMSFKTAAKWDFRKEKDAQHDMQGLSEGVEVEKRLSNAWTAFKKCDNAEQLRAVNEAYGLSIPMFNYLGSLSAPPRILGIRYEYMLKGDRWTDKDLSAKLGAEVRSQRSHLVRGYLNQGMTSGDEQWNWSWDYLKEGGETSKLYWKTWRSTPVWEHMTIKKWIDLLDASVLASGEEGHEFGYSSPAQATGFTAAHPLDEIFLPPLVVYRNEDELRDWIEQVEAQEVEVAQHVAKVNAAADEGKKRHLLNIHFQMSRRACEYPTTCSMSRVCWGGEEIRANPLGSGLYKIRIPNHPVEGEGR